MPTMIDNISWVSSGADSSVGAAYIPRNTSSNL